MLQQLFRPQIFHAHRNIKCECFLSSANRFSHFPSISWWYLYCLVSLVSSSLTLLMDFQLDTSSLDTCSTYLSISRIQWRRQHQHVQIRLNSLCLLFVPMILRSGILFQEINNVLCGSSCPCELQMKHQCSIPCCQNNLIQGLKEDGL